MKKMSLNKLDNFLKITDNKQCGQIENKVVTTAHCLLDLKGLCSLTEEENQDGIKWNTSLEKT